ncbi:hypothetical protein JOF55_002736 [Haloactinomyces albus]|uniref:Uncharacterized protein n=1 Tax=Haloactinomyces albus TaxID=1352928 RepID=A0AAE3ZEZ2_9ACTN|nr:hypothetical protein [Haloactinomyces albus]
MGSAVAWLPEKWVRDANTGVRLLGGHLVIVDV